MNKYKIIIINEVGCLVYNDIIFAKNENIALRLFLDDYMIYAGDKITVEEVI